MMRVLVVTVLMVAGFARGQDKPATVDADRLREAQAKLEAKDKARQVERDKPVTITAGELSDLHARIDQLEAELKAARGGTTKPVPTATAKRNPTKPEVGMTRAEVEKWVKSTLGAYRIASTASRGGRGIESADVMKIERVAKGWVASGSKTNALGQDQTTYGKEERAELAYTVTFTDGVVTGVR